MDLFANGENAERRKIVRYISLVAEAVNRDADAAQLEGRGLSEARLRREACLLWSMATDIDQGEHHGARLNKLHDERRKWRTRREPNPYAQVADVLARPDLAGDIFTSEDIDPPPTLDPPPIAAGVAAPPEGSEMSCGSNRVCGLRAESGVCDCPVADPPLPAAVIALASAPPAEPVALPLPTQVIRAAAVEEDDRVPHPALVALAQMAHAPPVQPPPAPKLTGLFGSREKAGRPPRHEAAQPAPAYPDDSLVPQSARSIPAADVAAAPVEKKPVVKPEPAGNATAGFENLTPPRSHRERRDEKRTAERELVAAMQKKPSKPSNGQARPLARRPADWQGAPVLLQDGDEDA